MANRTGGHKHDYVWEGLLAPMVATSSVPLVLASFDMGGFGAGTIMRIRGDAIVEALADGTGDSDILAIGIALVSTPAAVAGGASLPSLFTEVGYPWIWYQMCCLEAATAALDGSHILSNWIFTIDSKAMRKFKPAETLVIVAERSITDFTSVSVSAGIRFLIDH